LLELLKSQLTIIACTSSVKVMVVRREDKSFLNETLKNIIDRKLIEKKFRDADRPFDRMGQVLDRANAEKEWTAYKNKLEVDLLREVAMSKKINKLLD